VVSATPEVEERLGKKRASSDGPELTSEQRKKLALIGGLLLPPPQALDHLLGPQQ
jgi:hypothetical protein